MRNPQHVPAHIADLAADLAATERELNVAMMFVFVDNQMRGDKKCPEPPWVLGTATCQASDCHAVEIAGLHWCPDHIWTRGVSTEDDEL